MKSPALTFLAFVFSFYSFGLNAKAIIASGKIQAGIFISNTETIFNGQQQGVKIETNPESLNVFVTYDNYYEKPVNAGEYSVRVEIIDENYEGVALTTFNIYKAVATVHFTITSAVYDGAEKSITFETEPAGLNVDVTYNGVFDNPVNAGNYSVMGAISERNYKGGDVTNFSILPASAEIQILSPLNVVFDGQNHPANISTIPESLPINVLYNNSMDSPLNAGEYEIKASITDPNYKASIVERFEIEKALIDFNIQADKSVYTGKEMPVTIISEMQDIDIDVFYNGSIEVPVNAGSYDVTAVVNNKDYQGTATANYRIEKAPAIISISNLNQVYGENTKPIIVNTVPENLEVGIFYNGNNEAPVNAGDYYVFAHVTDDNYFAETSNILTISMQTQQIVWEQELSQIQVGDEVELLAESSSGLELEYVSSNPEVADVSGNWLIVGGVGKTIITAFQTGTENISDVYDSVEVNIESIEISDETEEAIDIKIWPNPVQEYLFVNSPGAEQVEVKIINGSGDLVKDQTYAYSNPNINMSTYSPGIYIVKIIAGGQEKEHKIFKQ